MNAARARVLEGLRDALTQARVSLATSREFLAEGICRPETNRRAIARYRRQVVSLRAAIKLIEREPTRVS